MLTVDPYSPASRHHSPYESISRPRSGMAFEYGNTWHPTDSQREKLVPLISPEAWREHSRGYDDDHYHSRSHTPVIPASMRSAQGPQYSSPYERNPSSVTMAYLQRHSQPPPMYAPMGPTMSVPNIHVPVTYQQSALVQAPAQYNRGNQSIYSQWHSVEPSPPSPPYEWVDSRPKHPPLPSLHKYLKAGKNTLVVDMSSRKLETALPPWLHGHIWDAASTPAALTMTVKCDAFTEPLVIRPGTANAGFVSLFDVLNAIYRMLHSSVDGQPSTGRGTGPKRGLFDETHYIDLLHGQHRFTGLQSTEQGYWTILFE